MIRRARMTVMVAGSVAAVSQMAMAGPWRPGTGSVGWTKVAHHGSFGSGSGSGGPSGGFGGAGDSFPMVENFDSYAAGSGFPCVTAAPNCSGPNGFGLWVIAENSSLGIPGPNDATISSAQSHSPPNSMLMGGSAVDVVQTGNVTSGQWKVSIQTYVSSGTNGNPQDKVYLIVMNNYQPPAAPTANNQWSVQVGLDRTTGLLTDFNTGQTHGTLIRDQWVLVEILIDIAADTYSVNYNGALAWGPLPYSTALGAGGLHAIQCIDLFSDDSSGVYLDDVSVGPVVTPPACYPNCDASTTVPCLNVLDFSCFLNAFAAGATYANCDNSTTVPVLNVLDFSCFLNRFAAGCSSC